MTALTDLAALLNRHDGYDAKTAAVLRKQMNGAIRRADEAFDALCERISQRRDWLDKHRNDDPPHPAYEKRRTHFYSVDSRDHAEAGEVLDRAYRMLTLSDCEAA